MERAEIVYRYNQGIECLEKPQMVDLSLYDEIEFNFDKSECWLEINHGIKMPVIDGKCRVKIKHLRKATNTLRLISNYWVIPCQPLDVFMIGDALKCDVACSLDVLKLVNDLQEKVIELKGRLEEVEALKPAVMFDKINSLVEACNLLSERVNELEKGFDPTLV